MSKIKLVCFDLDKTLIEQASWPNLSRALGVTPEQDRKFYKAYHDGKINYREWTDNLLAIYKNSPDANLKKITEILSRNVINDDVKKVVEGIKAKGYIVVVVSGSINILLDLVAKDLNIPFAQAISTFIFDENDKLKDIISYENDYVAKLNILEGYCQKLGIDITECACIGDGDNDIELFRKSGHGITLKGSKIESEAWKVIDSLADLNNLL